MITVAQQAISFDCQGAVLVGILHRPDHSAAIGVVAVTGGPQYRAGSHRHYVHLARMLASAGFPALRFDHRGCGDSEGESAGFEGIAEDIRAAIDAMQRAVPNLRSVVLFGLCDAAAACLLYCATDTRVVGLMLANPWVRTEQGAARSFVRHYYWRRLMQGSFWRKLVAGKVGVVNSAMSLLRNVARASAPSVDSSVAYRHFVDGMLAGLLAFSGRVLVLLSERDLTAREFQDLSVRDAGWRKAIARSTVKVAQFAGADHTFSSASATNAVAASCSQWLQDGYGLRGNGQQRSRKFE